MSRLAEPIARLRGPVRALFTDLDGTMTSDGRLHRETFDTLDELFTKGMPVVLVTGRSSGWGHALASLLPFAAVITENGGVSFLPKAGGFRKLYGVPESELGHWQQRMQAATRYVQSEVPTAHLSADSQYRELDLAIDWNEDRHLSEQTADRVVELLQEQGLTASRSSVHVNYAPPGVDKLTAATRVASELFGGWPLEDFVFVGDSLNDAPMFGGFAKSVGVANVQGRWSELSHKPKYVTDAPEGAGFCELVAHLLTLG